jgi:hypothetical protein
MHNQAPMHIITVRPLLMLLLLVDADKRGRDQLGKACIDAARNGICISCEDIILLLQGDP